MPERHHKIRHNPGRFSDRCQSAVCVGAVRQHPFLLTPKPT